MEKEEYVVNRIKNLSEPIVEHKRPKVNIKQSVEACETGKIGYPTQLDADRASKLMKKRHKGMKWYRCEFCDQFHLTSTKHTRKGKIRIKNR